MAHPSASEQTAQPPIDRPWGRYQQIATADGFQVKLIRVRPGGKLSLQYHHHRTEHWVIVAGTALVTRDDEEHRLGINEYIHIPLGSVHRLGNPGDTDLVLVEVQTGDYLGEDDIVRLEDIYGRCGDTP